MKKKVSVSTPSRICLFGEHQDYLGLEVISMAVNLRFYATAVERDDSIIDIKIRDERQDYLGAAGSREYEEYIIDLNKPIVYERERDYLKSTVNVLKREGYKLKGCNIVMDSEIPIGKGMSSSTTMILAFARALLDIAGSHDRSDPERIAELAFNAEVTEFDEPGGRMDHYTSAAGGLLHLDFREGMRMERINFRIPGKFILFDTLERKDTTRVLASGRKPVENALKELERAGITSIRDFYYESENIKYLDMLDTEKRKKLRAGIDNFRLLKEAEKMLKGFDFSPDRFGRLILQHHFNLREGLGISTPPAEEILRTSLENGAYGGKINGSGGGGCVFAYCSSSDAERILNEVVKLGYPGKILEQDSGLRTDTEELIK